MNINFATNAVDNVLRAWDILVSLMHHIPPVRRFDDWVNAKEQAWRARRMRPLITQLRAAGLHAQADQLADAYRES